MKTHYATLDSVFAPKILGAHNLVSALALEKRETAYSLYACEYQEPVLTLLHVLDGFVNHQILMFTERLGSPLLRFMKEGLTYSTKTVINQKD